MALVLVVAACSSDQSRGDALSAPSIESPDSNEPEDDATEAEPNQQQETEAGTESEQSDGTSSDGPVVHIATLRNDALPAELEGTVTYDPDSNCWAFDNFGRADAIVWPFGTTWDPATESVVLADGTEISDGAHITTSGGGFQSDAPGQQTVLGDAYITMIQRCDLDNTVVINDQTPVLVSN